MRWQLGLAVGLSAAFTTCVLMGCSSQGGATTGAAGPETAASVNGAGLQSGPGGSEAEKTPPAPADANVPGPAPKGFPATKDAPASEEPPVEADLPALIAGLQSTHAVAVFEATEQFRKLPADLRRNVLAELSAQENASVRQNAWRAFATWAARDDVPILIAALQSPYEDVRVEALALIARFPNDETIGVLTKVLEDPASRERGERLLASVGPAAESAVLAYHTHADATLRAAAWRILGQIGRRKSLLALEQAATKAEFQKDPGLKEAIERIRERLRG